MVKKPDDPNPADIEKGDENALEADFEDVHTDRAPLKMSMDLTPERVRELSEHADDIAGEEELLEEELLEEDEEIHYAEVAEPKTPFEEFFDQLSDDSDETATIIVYRKQDPKNTRFRIPCTSPRIRVCTMVWASSQGGPEEFYEALAQQEGGGFYDFQIRTRRGFSDKTWERLIGDPARPSEREITAKGETAKESEQTASQSFAPQREPEPRPSAFEEMKQVLKQGKEIRELLGVDDHAGETPPLKVEDQLKLRIFDRMADRPELQDKLTDLAFGIFQKSDTEESTTPWDVAKEAVRNPGATIQLITGITQLAGNLFGGLFQRPAPSQPAVHYIPLPPQVVPGVPLPTAAPVPVPQPQAADTSPQDAATQPAVSIAPKRPIKRVTWS